MSVSTIKATIQMRKGLETDFDADQMTAGEWAVSTDTRYVRMCFAPGIVIRMATYEAFEQDMTEIQTILATCQNIQTAVEAFEQLAEQHALQAEIWSVESKSWAIGGTGTRDGEDTNNSKYWSRQSKNEADRAKNEADRAASIAGIDIDSELSLTSTNPVQNKVVTNALNNIDVDISSDPVEFSEASARANIESGETIPTVFGKVKKWFTDLKNIAFSASYNDLIDAPDPTAVKGNEESEYRTGNVNLTPENIGAIPTSKIIQSANITETGFLMDGKTASDAIASLNNLHLFSESETKIGSLQNGTPVYRKIVKAPMTDFVAQTSGYHTVNIQTGILINDVLSSEIFAVGSAGVYPFPYSGTGVFDTWLKNFFKQGTQTTMQFLNKTAWGASYTLNAVIVYTK